MAASLTRKFGSDAAIKQRRKYKEKCSRIFNFIVAVSRWKVYASRIMHLHRTLVTCQRTEETLVSLRVFFPERDMRETAKERVHRIRCNASRYRWIHVSASNVRNDAARAGLDERGAHARAREIASRKTTKYSALLSTCRPKWEIKIHPQSLKVPEVTVTGGKGGGTPTPSPPPRIKYERAKQMISSGALFRLSRASPFFSPAPLLRRQNYGCG